MKNRTQRIVSMILALCLTLTLCACGQDATPTQADAAASTTTAAEKVTLKAWAPLGDKASQVITNNSEIPVYGVLADITNVDIEWINVSNADADIKFFPLVKTPGWSWRQQGDTMNLLPWHCMTVESLFLL